MVTMKQVFRHTWDQIKKPKNRPFLIAFAITAALPILLLFWFVTSKSVNAPFWDQWIYADILGRIHNGTFTFHDIWVQHNEHRLVFPKIIQLSVAMITQWNTRIEVIMNFLITLSAYGLMLWMMWRTFKKRSFFIAGAAVTAWLLFSPLAYINWTWGFQFAFYFSVFATTLAVWALYKNSATDKMDAWFWLAVSGAIMCNYSMGNGLLAWAAGSVMLLVYGAGKNKLIAWHAAAVASVALYFYHFHLSGGGLSALIKRPLEGLQYILQYLGHPLGARPETALMAGIILVAIAGLSVWVIWRKKELARVAPWLALGSYGLLTALMAAASRMGPFGVNHSMSFSYTTISVLFSIGTLVLAAYAAETSLKKVLRWRPKYLLAAGCMIGLIAYPFGTAYAENYLTGVGKMSEQSEHYKKVQACMYSAQSADDPCLLTFFPDKQQAWEKLQVVREFGWGRY